MSSPKSVLGVSGVCWVGFSNPTQFQALNYTGFCLLCGVCWVCRARACMTLFEQQIEGVIFSYARIDKPNQPNTLNSKLIRILISKRFICAGFVLGRVFFVSGSVFRGEGR